MSTSNDHGYVDEDGNVFLNAPEGPKKIGQFVDGSAAEGLEFFTRKFDNLIAESNLAIARLRDSKATPDAVKPLLERINAAIENPSMLGDIAKLPAIKAELEEHVEKRKAEVSAAKAAAKAQALAKREEIAKAAEALVNSNQWKSTTARFAELLDEWKKLEKTDRGVEQELWKRFSHARSTFDKARRAYFQNLDTTRAEAVAAKERVLAKAEELAASTEWKETSQKLRSLVDEWKTLPRAARDVDDKLWARFKAIQDKFYDARNAANSERDSQLGGNLEVKMGLLEKAEALLPIVDLDKAKLALREIQEAWEKAGHVPRADKEKVERRMKAVEDAIRKAGEELWNRTKPEVVDRANSLVTSFETQLEKLTKQIAAAKSSGKDGDAVKLEAQKSQVESLLEAARQGASRLG